MVVHMRNSSVSIPVCDIRECLVCFLLGSGLGDTEGSFHWIFATTLTHTPVHCFSQSLSTIPLHHQARQHRQLRGL